MVKLVPAIVSVAVRAAPVLAATVNVTVPAPLPDAPAEIVTNVALLVAVHEHAGRRAVTGTEPVPPAAANDDVVMAPAVTVHDGVVGGVGVVLLFEQAAAIRSKSHRGQKTTIGERHGSLTGMQGEWGVHLASPGGTVIHRGSLDAARLFSVAACFSRS